MGDLKCAVCREPWDAHGVLKDGTGDMKAWEVALFLKGAGCPCCQGEKPEGVDSDESFAQFGSSLLCNGYDDFGHCDAILDMPTKPPAWVEPNHLSRLLWQCESCQVKVLESLDLPSEIDISWKEFFSPHAYSTQRQIEVDIECMDDEEIRTGQQFEEFGDKVFCPHCVISCARCDAHIFRYSSQLCDDTYDTGNSFHMDMWDEVVCCDCLEQSCMHCQGSIEDGTCECCYCENCYADGIDKSEWCETCRECENCCTCEKVEVETESTG